jgi:archaellum component FlaC
VTPLARKVIGDAMARRDRTLEDLREQLQGAEAIVSTLKEDIKRTEGEQADLRANL